MGKVAGTETEDTVWMWLLRCIYLSVCRICLGYTLHAVQLGVQCRDFLALLDLACACSCKPHSLRVHLQPLNVQIQIVQTHDDTHILGAEVRKLQVGVAHCIYKLPSWI